MNKKTRIFLTMTLIVISQILLAQPYRVTLRNETIQGTLLSNSTLSVYYPNGTLFESGIQSGNSIWLDADTWRFGTDNQYITTYKHKFWNSLSSPNAYLRIDDQIDRNKTEHAIFDTPTNATITINSNITGTDEKTWFEFRDPWWVENVGNQYQPNDFRSLEEMNIQSTHDVFLNMRVQPNWPYYSVHAPELVASTSGIYQFQSWGTVSGATLYDTNDPHRKNIKFTSSAVTINVNYTQVNTQSGTYTIPDKDRLIIPAGANIACNSGFKLAVDGKLEVRGTIDNPVTLTSSSNYWHGIYVNDGMSVV